MSIDKYYKEHNATGDITAKKAYRVNPRKLGPYAIPNIREKLDQEHIAYLESCYLSGEYVDPIVVVDVPTDTGLLPVLEGRHRTHAALKVLQQNPTFRVEIRTVPLEAAVQQYGFMLKSDRRLPFSFLEKALGVAAMKRSDPNLSTQQIADTLSVTKTAVENYLILATGDERTLDLIREGRISGSQVVEYIRDHEADKAYDAIIADLERAARAGKTTPRAPGSATKKFSHSKALDALEILLNITYDVKQLSKDKGEVTLKLGINDAKDLIAIIDDYQIHCGG